MNTQEQKVEIIRLYELGMGLSEIGRLFHIDHTTVLHHVRNKDKIIVYRRNKIRIEEKIEVKENKGKNYKDYLVDSMSVDIVRDDTGNIIEEKKISPLEFERRYGYKPGKMNMKDLY